ncbi:MAG: hypothetical protein OXF50_23350, partial [Caldilineaceae bacterium]|nr:hypothetical protein [Caldilineaceae bacterium]
VYLLPELYGGSPPFWDAPDQREFQALLDVQRRPLVQREEVRLQALRESYGKAMLRKARALALLSLRGGQPLLEALDVSD